MKGAFTCPHCMTQNACDCETCKPFIKEGEPVNRWDETGNYHICGKCGKSYSPDQSLNAEFKLTTGLYVTKPFIVANVREIIDGWEHFDPEGYSFSKMVEKLNEVAEKFYGKADSEPKEVPDLSSTEYYNLPHTIHPELAKEREKAKKLAGAVKSFVQASDDFNTGYINRNGEITRCGIAALSLALTAAEKRLRLSLTEYEKL